MLHDPLHLFDANAFYPHPLSLAFSDSLLGYGPAGVLRLGHRRGARPLQPAVPVRLVAVLRRRLPARARARPAQARRGRRGGRLRLRALPRDRGRAPARDLLRRHRRWRCSCCCAATGAARAGSCSPAGWCRPGRSASASRSACSSATCWPCSRCIAVGLLAAGRASARCRAALVAITCLGIVVVGAVADLPGAPVPEDLPRLPDRQAHDQGSQKLLGRSRRAAVGLLGEPRLGRPHRRRARARALQEREVLFPGGFILLLALIGLAAPLYTRRLRIGLAVGRGRLRGPRARPRADRRRLPLPAAVRLRARAGTACACRGACSRWRRCSSRCSRAPARSCSPAGAARCASRHAGRWGRGARWHAAGGRRRGARRSASSAKAPATWPTRSCRSPRRRRSGCPGRCWTCPPTAPPTACGSTSRPTASTRSRSATAPSTSPPSTTCAAA